MRHHNRNRKLGMKRKERRALLRTLATSLIRNGRIKTTVGRAKALRPFAEGLVTAAKKGNLLAVRLLSTRLGNHETAVKLIKHTTAKFNGRAGGYTRISKIGTRKGDGAPLALIEWV